MIKAENGVVKASGYTHELMKEMVGIIGSALEGNFLGETLEKRVTMLNMIIKMVKGKVLGKEPMEAVVDMDKDEVKAFMRLMAAINFDDDDKDDDDDDVEEQQTEDSNNEAKGKVTVICGGKKVVTDSDGIAKIIADMVDDEIKNNGKEKK